MELVNDLKGYQLIFPLPLHVVGTFFLRVNEGSLWNTSRFPKNLTRPLNRESCQIKETLKSPHNRKQPPQLPLA